jgi:hypothetical protein
MGVNSRRKCFLSIYLTKNDIGRQGSKIEAFMKSARIFLVEGKRKLTPMTETSYVTEDDLQALLADYPDLLPGDQINFEEPRRWILVARELRVPGSEDESGRWSLDHLFLDQEGIPTFVECKRATDTRGRREVVAQMLDYAANGIVYWQMDSLRQAAAETAQRSGKSLDEEILNLINSADLTDVDHYWKDVEHNLRAGTVRLIFVADTIPVELRRLVEFLNEKMSDIEVLAVEVKQFLGESQKAIVPRVLGITETTRERKPSQSSRPTNREQFLKNCEPEAAKFFAHLLDTAERREHTIYWGTKGFSIRVYLPKTDSYASVLYGFPPNSFDIYFAHIPLPSEKLLALRKEILSYGIFREAPKTLSMNLNISNFKKAEEAYELMLQRVEEIAKG